MINNSFNQYDSKKIGEIGFYLCYGGIYEPVYDNSYEQAITFYYEEEETEAYLNIIDSVPPSSMH